MLELARQQPGLVWLSAQQGPSWAERSGEAWQARPHAGQRQAAGLPELLAQPQLSAAAWVLMQLAPAAGLRRWGPSQRPATARWQEQVHLLEMLRTRQLCGERRCSEPGNSWCAPVPRGRALSSSTTSAHAWSALHWHRPGILGCRAKGLFI